MSELSASAAMGADSVPRRPKILGILLVSIVAVGAPVLLSVMLYTPDGISRNGLITHLLVPTADALLMLLIVLMARRTQAAGKLDFVWFRRGPIEIAGILLLPAVALAAMLLAAMAGDWLGVALPVDRTFMPEGRGPAFFVALAIRIAVLMPVVEELFWRGFVQRALERVAGGLPALLGQAVLFAAVHLAPFGRFGPALALGLVTGAWRRRRGTLLPIIVAHVVLNGLYCAGQWRHWQDYSKVKIATDSVAKMTEVARPQNYDPNDDARAFYERGFAAVAPMPEMLGAFRRGFPVDWSEEAFAEIRRWVGANEKALEYMAQGASKPYYWPHYVGGTAMLAGMPDAAGARDLAFVLDARIKLRAFDGEDDLLLADMTTLYRFARHLGGRKVLSHQLLGVSIRGLLIGTVRGLVACEPLRPETLAAIQHKLEEFEDEDRNVLDFAQEQLVWMDGIQRMFTDEGNGNGRIPRVAVTQWPGLPKPFQLLIEPMTPAQNAEFLALDRRQTTDCMNEFFTRIQLEAARTPWELRHDPNGAERVLRDLIRQNAFVGVLGTVCLGVIDLPWRERADLAALITTIAAIRYEAAQGDYPESLTKLVEGGYLRRVPQDPYSDGPLVYRYGADGFMLYSQGLDFDDDGGTPSQWGRGPEGGDQLFWPIR